MLKYLSSRALGQIFMEGYLYILKSTKNGRYYIGSSVNLERRVEEHNNGRVKSTKNILPLEIVFSVQFETIKEARQMEFKIKQKKSKDIIEKIIKNQKIQFEKSVGL